MNVNNIVDILREKKKFLSLKEIYEELMKIVDTSKYTHFDSAVRILINRNCFDRSANINKNYIFISLKDKQQKGQKYGLYEWVHNKKMIEIDDSHEDEKLVQSLIQNEEYFEDKIYSPDYIILNEKISIKRNFRFKIYAIQLANYCCEVDFNHVTFIRKSNNKNYTEAHHLIPLNRQFDKKFENVSLDCPANIVSLCSNCHNLLHYGKDKETILFNLYNKHYERLKRSGIDITFQELLSFYY